jgi:putative copper export protein
VHGERVVAHDVGTLEGISMDTQRRLGWSASAGRAAVIGMALLVIAGCALIQPPPMPGLVLRGGMNDASCASAVSRGHGALAAGTAAGDPSSMAAAHAAHAGAMHEYHTCLALRSRP